jgi:hypothetical protein
MLLLLLQWLSVLVHWQRLFHQEPCCSLLAGPAM